MGKTSLCSIISFAIITVFIYSAQLNIAQSLNYQQVANLSTTWINNPTINTSSLSIDDLEYKKSLVLSPVLSLSNTSQFISGFYCFPNETSCLFGILIFAERYDSGNVTTLSDPQLVWSRKSVMGLRFTEFGNLVLFDRNNATVWQSFDHPTDCLLLGQKLVTRQKLIASTSSSDFSRGLFSLSIDVFLVGYLEVNPPLVYYKSILAGYENFTSLKEAYVVFENGSFNGQNLSWVDSSVHEAGTREAFEGLRMGSIQIEDRGGFAHVNCR